MCVSLLTKPQVVSYKGVSALAESSGLAPAWLAVAEDGAPGLARRRSQAGPGVAGLRRTKAPPNAPLSVPPLARERSGRRGGACGGCPAPLPGPPLRGAKRMADKQEFGAAADPAGQSSERRDERGQFRPGVSGNPRGRPRSVARVSADVAADGADAETVFARLMADPRASPATQLAAARALHESARRRGRAAAAESGASEDRRASPTANLPSGSRPPAPAAPRRPRRIAHRRARRCSRAPDGRSAHLARDARPRALHDSAATASLAN